MDDEANQKRSDPPPTKMEQKERARSAGFTGDACPRCGNFTMTRTGTCLLCVSCGSTTGCS